MLRVLVPYCGRTGKEGDSEPPAKRPRLLANSQPPVRRNSPREEYHLDICQGLRQCSRLMQCIPPVDQRPKQGSTKRKAWEKDEQGRRNQSTDLSHKPRKLKGK
ncbi:hypothetical protein HAX54_002718 [Datura stramonium]|uniref:Uncharacterized protein n=1 Tax=Datura stramonium TaxID=4076 RepID=A0ABS8RT67_DATST|nr:hypothetical protein [Datura stramonium]